MKMISILICIFLIAACTIFSVAENIDYNKIQEVNNEYGILFVSPPELWNKTYGGDYYDAGFSVQQTSDSGYIIAGTTTPSDSTYTDILLVKTDSNGIAEWTKNYGGADSEYGYSVKETTDGGYIVGGYTYYYTTNKGYVYLLKTNGDGDQEWIATMGGPQLDEGFSVEQTTDGGYIITGFSDSFSSGRDIYLIKTDSIGKTEWERTFGGAGTSVGNCVKQTSDDGYIVAGFTNTALTKDDILLVKLEPDSPNLVIDFDDLVPSKYSLQQNYPDPFNPSTKIRYSVPYSSKVVIKVFDVLGNEIETLVNEEKPAGTYELTWYAEGLPSGVYFYQLQTNAYVETKKMVLLK